MVEGRLGLYQGQVPALTPLVVEDDPVEGDEGPTVDLLEVLDLPPPHQTAGRGEDEVGRDGRPEAGQPGARPHLVEPGVRGSADFPQPARALGLVPVVAHPVGCRVPQPPGPRPPSPPHLLASIEASLVQEELAARPGVGQPTGGRV